MCVCVCVWEGEGLLNWSFLSKIIAFVQIVFLGGCMEGVDGALTEKIPATDGRSGRVGIPKPLN